MIRQEILIDNIMGAICPHYIIQDVSEHSLTPWRQNFIIKFWGLSSPMCKAPTTCRGFGAPKLYHIILGASSGPKIVDLAQGSFLVGVDRILSLTHNLSIGSGTKQKEQKPHT
jgi:hypothetical protein